MRFVGAAGTVTGSRHVVSTPNGAIPGGAGLFQSPEGRAVPRHGEEVARA